MLTRYAGSVMLDRGGDHYRHLGQEEKGKPRADTGRGTTSAAPATSWLLGSRVFDHVPSRGSTAVRNKSSGMVVLLAPNVPGHR